jgi:hypothetical protein
MRRIGGLKVEEIVEAKTALIVAIQAGIKIKGNYQQLVNELNIVEQNSILRCKGRLGNADLDFEAREPIILPKDHRLT